MSILGTFMVPHPPLIVPSVGRGSEKQIQETIDSYDKIAKEIAELKPDTIIISSPHAPVYRDYFYLSTAYELRGDLSRFGAGDVSFAEMVDVELADLICDLAEEEDFPTGKVPNAALDHGTMIPLYFIHKYYQDFKILLVGISTMPLIKNYQMGSLIQKAVNQTGRKCVYVASGDLSHKLQEDGPYGFIEEGPIYDKRIMEDMSHGDFGKLLNYDPVFLDKVAECGHPSFTMMAGFLDGISVKPTYYSHQDVTGVGYGICSYYPIGEDVSRKFGEQYLEKIEESKSNEPYVRLAQETIETYITQNKILPVPDGLPTEMLTEQAGVFVSIHKYGQLRGCIGTFLPAMDCVAKEIIMNAIAASTRDPRFTPILEDELPFLDINVDVLSTPEDCSYEDLDPKKYGVIVSSGYKRGLLLPDLDGIDTVEDQVRIACRKGNIQSNEDIHYQRFVVIRHK